MNDSPSEVRVIMCDKYNLKVRKQVKQVIEHPVLFFNGNGTEYQKSFIHWDHEMDDGNNYRKVF